MVNVVKNWVIAQSAIILNDRAVTLLNRTKGGLNSPDVSLTHISMADKAELTVGADL